VVRDWRADQATWNSAASGAPWGLAGCNDTGSDRLGQAAHNTLIVAAAHWYELNLTDEVNGWLQYPSTNRGLALISFTKESWNCKLASSTYADSALRPELVLTYRVATLPTYSRALAPGWHLLSCPLRLPSHAVADVLASLGSAYDQVMSYLASEPADPWKWYSPSAAPGSNTLISLAPGMAFWVHMVEASVWSVQGTRNDTLEVPIYAGYNMIGWPYDSSRELGMALASIAGKYGRLDTMEYRNGQQSWTHHDSTLPAWANNLLQMTPGNGYWLWATQAGTLRFTP
jgi:hypothetical protein